MRQRSGCLFDLSVEGCGRHVQLSLGHNSCNVSGLPELHYLVPVVRELHGLAALVFALSLGNGNAFCLSLQDALSFELSQP